MIKNLVGAVLAGGILTTTAFAYVEQPTPWPQAPRADVPVVVKAVDLTGLPQRHEGATVELSFTVDTAGRPRNIRLLAPSDPELARRLIPTFAQWRFTPVQKNGVPVPMNVVMPLKLISKA
jgi:TonB family protein